MTHLPIPDHIPGKPGRRPQPDSLTGRLRALRVGEGYPTTRTDRNAFNTQLRRVRAETGARFVTQKIGGLVTVWRAE